MKKLPDRELLCYSYIAFRPWNHWNARRAILYCLLAGRDKSLYYLRPIIPWNVRSTIGTPAGQLEQPAGHNLLSAVRSVRAGNRWYSASRGFLCARVLDA